MPYILPFGQQFPPLTLSWCVGSMLNFRDAWHTHDPPTNKVDTSHTVDFQTSCTSWYGRYPIIYKVLYMQTVVGLGISEPSTVVFKTQWWLTWIPFLAWDLVCCVFLTDLHHETHHHGIQTTTIWDKIFGNFFQASFKSKSNFVTCGFPRFASWDLFSRICETFQGQSHPVQDKEVLCEGGDWWL